MSFPLRAAKTYLKRLQDSVTCALFMDSVRWTAPRGTPPTGHWPGRFCHPYAVNQASLMQTEYPGILLSGLLFKKLFLSQFAFCSYDKCRDWKKLKRKGLLWLTGHNPSLRDVKAGTRGRRYSRNHGGSSLLTCVWAACSTTFFTLPRPTCPDRHCQYRAGPSYIN